MNQLKPRRQQHRIVSSHFMRKIKFILSRFLLITVSVLLTLNNYGQTSTSLKKQDSTITIDKHFSSDTGLLKTVSFQDTLLRINAILDDSVKEMSYCGTFIISVVYKFEIISVVEGTYLNKYIKILFVCPREMGDNYFQKGKMYYLKVTKADLSKYISTKLPDSIPTYKYSGTFF